MDPTETHLTIRVLGICGSLRAQSLNMLALKAAAMRMPADMELSMASIAGLPVYDFDIQQAGFPAAAETLRDAVARADAILFASPEYNWSVGAPLKNAIDWLSRFAPQPFMNKPAAVLSATTGPLGGARGQYDLRRIMSGLGVHWLAKPEIFIGSAQHKFSATDGTLTDEVASRLLAEQMAALRSWVLRMRCAVE